MLFYENVNFPDQRPRDADGVERPPFILYQVQGRLQNLRTKRTADGKPEKDANGNTVFYTVAEATQIQVARLRALGKLP